MNRGKNATCHWRFVTEMDRSRCTVGSVAVIPPLKNEFRNETPLTANTIEEDLRADEGPVAVVELILNLSLGPREAHSETRSRI